MEEKTFFCTIDSFYQLLKERGQLAASKCKECGKTILPPKPVCTNCYSTDMELTPIKNEGQLLTYTIIHVAPTQFQSDTPYAVGIVQLDDNLKLPGMIKEVDHNKLQIGMQLKLEVETREPDEWPVWPRYFFKPTQPE